MSRAEAAADDRALVARMRDGDERALGLLYDRWSSAVYALALRITGDRAESEDVVEETFWQAWRQAGRYEGARGSAATWLLTIARSRALDRQRAMRRRREEELIVAPAAGADTAPDAAALESAAADPAAAVEAAERYALVAGALRELPREQREAVELAYFGGLSQTEIAERTSQPLGTVKTRIRLAMQKLRERLAPLREGAP